MNVYHDLVFSYLEEDNTQRAYFRVKPLLSPSGDIQEDARRTWPDDGALRIVPDRAEQFHFKDRMRELGHYCLMDLTAFDENTNKIRTNKNYNPTREEANQFILYSDAVKPLPPHTFYQVVPGSPEDHAALSEQAVTPLFFIRKDETLFGPVAKGAENAPETAAQAEGTLFSLTCPDGAIRDILCIPEAKAAPEEAPKAATVPFEKPAPIPAETPAPVPVQAEEKLDIGKPLQILDTAKGFDEQLAGIAQPLSSEANLLHASPAPVRPAAPRPVPGPGMALPLSGTPLYRSTNLRTATPKPKNPVQEVVAAQWRAARNDPPAASLAAGAGLHPVDNPVEDACRMLTRAWHLPEAQQQLTDHILSLPGMAQRLTRSDAADAGATPLQKVLSARLQDLEAERLAALFELDKAKADVESFRKTCVEQASQEQKRSLTEAEKALSEKQTALAALQAQLTALAAQRDALVKEIDHLQGEVLPEALAKALEQAHLVAPLSGTPLRLQAAVGEDAAPQVLIERTMKAFSDCGAVLTQPEAVTYLLLLALAPRFTVVSPALGAAATLLQGWMRCCAWEQGFAVQETAAQRPVPTLTDALPSPLLLLTTLMVPACGAPVHTVLLAKTAALHARTNAWEMAPWPLWQLPALPVISLPAPSGLAPISDASLRLLVSDADAATDAQAEACLAPVLRELTTLGLLTGPLHSALKTFTRCAVPLMEGGLAVAVDYALSLYLPGLAALNPRVASAVNELLAEYPITAALMRR